MDTLNNDQAVTGSGDTSEPRRLDVLLADTVSAGHPVVVALTWSGHETVVVGHVDDDNVRIAPAADGLSAVVSASVPACRVTDPARQLDIYQRAVTQLGTALQTSTAELREVRQQHTALHAQIGEIRQYAIDRHNDGQICREGLNRFLSYFEMPEYVPRVRVEFTIAGSYLVDDDDPHRAARDARTYLRADFGSIDGFIGGSDSLSVTAHAAAN